MQLRAFRFGLALAAFALAPALLAQELNVVRAGGTSATVTADQIAALPHVSVSVQDHDATERFDTVPSFAVLKLAGVVSDAKMKGRN
jgi:hypothetical protein